MSQFLSVSFVAITNKCDIFNNMKTVTVVTSIKSVTGKCDKYENCDNCVSNYKSDNCVSNESYHNYVKCDNCHKMKVHDPLQSIFKHCDCDIK